MENALIIKRVVVSHLSANCWIVGSTASGKGLVIDPGGEAGDILKAIRESRLDIEVIVLTHGHSDHIEGNPHLSKAACRRAWASCSCLFDLTTDS